MSFGLYYFLPLTKKEEEEEGRSLSKSSQSRNRYSCRHTSPQKKIDMISFDNNLFFSPVTEMKCQRKNIINSTAEVNKFLKKLGQGTDIKVLIDKKKKHT